MTEQMKKGERERAWLAHVRSILTIIMPTLTEGLSKQHYMKKIIDSAQSKANQCGAVGAVLHRQLPAISVILSLRHQTLKTSGSAAILPLSPLKSNIGEEHCLVSME